MVFGEKAALATSVLNFTLDGIPLLYNGEEVGDSTAPQQQSHVAIRWDIWKPESQRRTSIAGQQNARLRVYKQLIQMRRDEAALTSGELTWVNNSNPDGVVSFIRKTGKEEILVLDQPDQPHHQNPGGRAGRELCRGSRPSEDRTAAGSLAAGQIQLPAWRVRLRGRETGREIDRRR